MDASTAGRAALDRARGLPAGAFGLGLRAAHFQAAEEAPPEVDYLEVISENFLQQGSQPRSRLNRIRRRHPVVLHGVGLDLLGHEPLDERYLDALARLADEIDSPFVTDHLCWSAAHGHRYHDLLPTPYRAELVEYAAARADHVQRRLGRPFGIENLSSYVEFEDSTMPEWEFYAAVVRTARCWALLDVNNLFVSARNHGFDPATYLGAVDWTRVLEVHVAGHTVEPSGLRIDTHDHPVCQEVWTLYRAAWALGGPFPTLLEWDARIPPLPELVAEVMRAKDARS